MQLDEDSSGNISKDELIFAMKKMCARSRIALRSVLRSQRTQFSHAPTAVIAWRTCIRADAPR